MTASQSRRLQNILRTISEDIGGHPDRTLLESCVFTVASYLKFRACMDYVLPRSDVQRAKTGEPAVFLLPTSQRRPECPNPS